MAELAEWESFYVIVGSAAAALIGLQFVVMTLIADRPHIATQEAGAAFASPTIFHFSVVLLLSAILRAPWHAISSVAAIWGFVGFAGLAYGAIVVRRMRAQKTYQPDFEDWLFHAILPFAAYALVFLSAFGIGRHTDESLFGVAAGVLFLLFIGIHNVWDTVSYQVFVTIRKSKD
jgi:hypothetical protein